MFQFINFTANRFFIIITIIIILIVILLCQRRRSVRLSRELVELRSQLITVPAAVCRLHQLHCVGYTSCSMSVTPDAVCRLHS